MTITELLRERFWDIIKEKWSEKWKEQKKKQIGRTVSAAVCKLN